MAFKKGAKKPDGSGRKRGTTNRRTAALAEMIMQALADVGGVDYLKAQALENPKVFVTLVGKVLPLQVAGPDYGPVHVDHSISPAVADAIRSIRAIMGQP